MRTRAVGAIALAAAGLALAACATNTPTGSGGGPNRTTTTSVVPTTGTPSASETDNGHTITVTVGQRLQVVLHSTYWHFTDPTGTTLRAAGQQTATQPLNSPNGHCVPGEGCGTVTAWYDAVAPGTTTVTANRTSCGEARGCGPNDGSYQLTVVVR